MDRALIERAIASAKARIYKLTDDEKKNPSLKHQKKIERQKEVMEVTVEALEKYAEYKDAEEQGLLLRMPCKVGGTVFHEKKYATWFQGVNEYQITNIIVSQNKKGIWTKKYRAMMLLNGKTTSTSVDFSFDDIGKTVFLTKEEAEAALENMKGE